MDQLIQFLLDNPLLAILLVAGILGNLGSSAASKRQKERQKERKRREREEREQRPMLESSPGPHVQKPLPEEKKKLDADELGRKIRELFDGGAQSPAGAEPSRGPFAERPQARQVEPARAKRAAPTPPARGQDRRESVFGGSFDHIDDPFQSAGKEDKANARSSAGRRSSRPPAAERGGAASGGQLDEAFKQRPLSDGRTEVGRASFDSGHAGSAAHGTLGESSQLGDLDTLEEAVLDTRASAPGIDGMSARDAFAWLVVLGPPRASRGFDEDPMRYVG